MANTLTGKVIQNSLDKTITVKVVNYKNHPLYKKRYTYSKKYLAHDPQNQAQINDLVVIKVSRPLSKRKHFALDKILETHTPKGDQK